jgi:hypothetical protein
VRSVLVGVDERVLAVGPGVPAGAVDHPAALGERAVLGLPTTDVVDLQQEVRVVRAPVAEVENDHRSDQVVDGDAGDVGAVLAGHPVVRCVEVRAGVLAAAEVVPVPRRSALVVPADLLQLEPPRLPELGRQRDHRGVAGEAGGEVDDLDGPVSQRGGQRSEHGHGASSFHWGVLGRAAGGREDPELDQEVVLGVLHRCTQPRGR